MAFFKGDIYSSALGMNTELNVIIPGDPEQGTQPPKVVYLLHGLTDNASSWSRMTSVERYAKEYGYAVVMPGGERSFYQDMKFGMNYFQYISKELPSLVQKMFQVSKEPSGTFIAGLSMGGYGALRCVLTNPRQYGAAAAFSSVADIRYWCGLKQERGLMLDELAGFWGPDFQIPDDADLFHLAETASSSGGCPPIYMACGLQDPLQGVNHKLHNRLLEKGLPAAFEEWDGGHEWAFWDEAIRKAFAFFAKAGGERRS